MWHQINTEDVWAWWIGNKGVIVNPKTLSRHFYVKLQEVM
jgi:hypothetical protein